MKLGPLTCVSTKEQHSSSLRDFDRGGHRQSNTNLVLNLRDGKNFQILVTISALSAGQDSSVDRATRCALVGPGRGVDDPRMKKG
jgi:hypothetical protein